MKTTTLLAMLASSSGYPIGYNQFNAVWRAKSKNRIVLNSAMERKNAAKREAQHAAYLAREAKRAAKGNGDGC